MGVIVIVPARAGSVGIPGKNMVDFGGFPLIEWTIVQAQSSPVISDVLVSTDSPEIYEFARNKGCWAPDLRPGSLASCTASTESVIDHALENWIPKKADRFLLMQPTSPLRSQLSIDQAARMITRTEYDSFFSGCIQHQFVWGKRNVTPFYDPARRPRRQELTEDNILIRENGSIYGFTRTLFERSRCRLGGDVGLLMQESWESIEIDEPIDIEIAEVVLRYHESQIVRPGFKTI
jgi:CMP-N,N'-diacetyllegionaminic acid synthase